MYNLFAYIMITTAPHQIIDSVKNLSSSSKYRPTAFHILMISIYLCYVNCNKNIIVLYKTQLTVGSHPVLALSVADCDSTAWAITPTSET